MNSSPSLTTRHLGRTGVSLSIIGLGTVKFGRDTGVKYPGSVRIPTDQEASALLTAAEGLGVNVLDTAPAYGNSEERLGRLLEARTHPWFLVTKAGEAWDGTKSTFDFSESAIRASIERSRSRLNVQSLGCVLLHSDGAAEQHESGFAGAIRALEQARSAGMVRTIGASLKTVAGADRAIRWADVLMLEFGSEPEFADVAGRASDRGIGLLAKKALASGHLDKLGPDPVRTAMKHTLSIPGVCSVIVGTTNVKHLRENVDAAARASDEFETVRKHRENGA